MRRTCAALVLALCNAGALGAQSRITGLAYDSLASKPLANAYVAIPKLHRSTTADSLGRFTFESIASGTYVFHLQHDALDAIGMSDYERQLTIRNGRDEIVVAVPSFESFWAEMCSGPPPSDSAIVFGTVAAMSHRAATRASVAVGWLDLVVVNRKMVSQHKRQGRVDTDDTGRYVLCGVPMNTGLTLRATKDEMDSGLLDLLPLQRGVQRRDIQLNAPGVAQLGTVSGTVTLEGREPTGARVAIDGLPEVRVNADGKFTIRNVPVGTRAIEATFIGMSPALATIDVAPGAITTLELQLKKVVELPGMTVAGSAVRTQLAREFDQRRAQGIGQFRDSTQIAKYPALESVFQDMNNLFVKGPAGRRAIYAGSCGTPAMLIVDGVVTAAADFAWRDQRDIAGIEVYTNTNYAPMEFRSKMSRGGACGIVVVWTRNRFP